VSKVSVIFHLTLYVCICVCLYVLGVMRRPLSSIRTLDQVAPLLNVSVADFPDSLILHTVDCDENSKDWQATIGVWANFSKGRGRLSHLYQKNISTAAEKTVYLTRRNNMLSAN